MKKIFYLLFFVILCFIYNFEIKAEEIDCNSQPYACVKCTYPSSNFNIEFVVYSNGSTLNLVKNETKGTGIGSINYNVTSNNFKNDNKLFCPSSLYFTTSMSGHLLNYNLTFEYSNNNNVGKISLSEEKNNNKTVFDETKNILSCNYNVTVGNVNIETDGEKIWVNSGDITIMNQEITVNDFLDNNGNLLDKNNCPNLYFVCTNRNGKYCSIYNKNVGQGSSTDGDSNISGEDIVDLENYLNGNRYKELLGSLKTPLSIYDSGALSIPLTIDGNTSATLNDVDANDLLCSSSDCSSNARYYSEQGLKDIKNYCNELYSNYDKYKNEPNSLKKRMDECVSFNNFYSELVNQGIVDNLANYCGVLSQDFAAKLKYFLNIIKIAGPLLALGLGTVDFVKVLANGDADKEMKNAFKRFVTRLAAAALLFLVPIILAFLLDLFVKPGSGYDPDNPFCDIVDWNS